MEIWSSIKDFETHYEVSNYGRVKSLKWGKERILSSGANSDGYLLVVLHLNKQRFTKYVHLLVASAFNGFIPDGGINEIDHNDGNKLNNHNLNLVVRPMVYHRRKGAKGYSKSGNKWRARIVLDGKVKNLGCFKNEVDASKAYKTALKEIIN